MRPASSPRWKLTVRFIPCKSPAVSKAGTSRPLRILNSPSKVRVTSPTSSACADAESPLANFLASGVLLLGEKLGPFLWQLPPNFKYDPERIESFIKLLPHDTGAAKYLASNHDPWMKKRVAFDEVADGRKLRHAMEIRNTTFAIPEFLELLRKYDIAIVCADTVEWPESPMSLPNLSIAACTVRKFFTPAGTMQNRSTDGQTGSWRGPRRPAPGRQHPRASQKVQTSRRLCLFR